MEETARDPAGSLPGLRPCCHRCDATLVGSPAACPRCVERLKPTTGPSLIRFARWRLRTLIALVAVAACTSAWGIHAWRRRLADDRGRFYTHEEMVPYQAFLKEVALGEAQDAEQKAAAAAAVGDRRHWTEEADAWRAKASAHERAEAKYRWRAELKQRLGQGEW